MVVATPRYYSGCVGIRLRQPHFTMDTGEISRSCHRTVALWVHLLIAPDFRFHTKGLHGRRIHYEKRRSVEPTERCLNIRRAALGFRRPILCRSSLVSK